MPSLTAIQSLGIDDFFQGDDFFSLGDEDCTDCTHAPLAVASFRGRLEMGNRFKNTDLKSL